MQRYTLLLVDDNPLVLETKTTIFENEGYHIIPAQNGKIAIEILENEKIDLVITDLVMEDIDGIDVLKKAKSINPEIMVIILTGYSDMASAIDALHHNADDFMLKPCEVEEILFRVDRCFQKQALLKKLRLYENLLPVCSQCKKIKYEFGEEVKWLTTEEYFRELAVNNALIFCPDCANT